MAKRHHIAEYVSTLRPLDVTALHESGDLTPEIKLLQDLAVLPKENESLLPFLRKDSFDLIQGWCEAPRQQNGYEGPVFILKANNGRHYVITREDNPSELCLQIGDAAQYSGLMQEFDNDMLVCFGATPHIISGEPHAVMKAIKRDIIESGTVELPQKGPLREAWGQAVVDYLGRKSEQRREIWALDRVNGFTPSTF